MVRLTFLGKASENGESPTLYATDRDSYVVQGYTVTDEEVLARLDIPGGEIVVEVYARLLEFLSEDGVSGAVTDRRPPIVRVRENGNYIIQGPRLSDDAARNRMAIPGHEDAVEVPKAAIVALLEGPACN
ncbi:hypothetical protein [Dactylosporangium sp. NPDC051484]|uniref:hypothetical protein n=1 Tax=Dactylosporangium sp. NPDC051484 TaxID=3154942 RepID=UPI00344C040F